MHILPLKNNFQICYFVKFGGKMPLAPNLYILSSARGLAIGPSENIGGTLCRYIRFSGMLLNCVWNMWALETTYSLFSTGGTCLHSFCNLATYSVNFDIKDVPNCGTLYYIATTICLPEILLRVWYPAVLTYSILLEVIFHLIVNRLKFLANDMWS